MTEQAYIAHLVAKAKAAVAEVDAYTQAQTDRMCKVAAKTCWDHAVLLGTTAYQETGMGILPSKINKNRTAALCYEWMKGKPSVGILEDNPLTNIVTIAKPVGVVAGITPSTNPTSTAGFYATICLKCRNALILAPHPRARKSTNLVADLIRAQLREIGAPEDLVQCLGSAQYGDIQLSNDLTGLLMQASDMIIATGGAGMVKAAYSSGTPCYGVGQGNVQVLVDEGFTDYDQITSNILASRTNDAGTNCTGEQTLYVPQRQKADLIAAFEAKGCVCVRDPADIDKLRKGIFPDGGPINRLVPGKQPKDALAEVGVTIPDCPLVLVDLESYGAQEPLAREILFPILRVNSYTDFEEALAEAKANLLLEGAGHSSSIYSNDDARILHAGMVLPVCRLSVKMPNVAVTGLPFSNGMPPTITIGCGTWGGNSGSDNLNYTHLLNKTRIIRTLEHYTEKDIDEIFLD